MDREMNSSRRMETTGRARRSSGTQSKIERLNTEAQTVLSKKSNEIEQLSATVEEAEKQLVKLKAELEAKTATAAQADDNDQLDGEDGDADLIRFKEGLDAEIQQTTARHEKEIAALRARYSKALKEAEDWAEQHAETVFVEKSEQLEDLKRELAMLKAQVSEAAFSQTQTRTRQHQQSQSAAVQNAQRVQYLEAQLSELSSVTREELREVRSKIDECLSAVDLREQEHKSEVERYEREIAQREEQYDTHLETVTEQSKNEKQRLDQQYQAAVAKTENLQRVLKQLEKHHEMQLQTTLKDNERMRTTIYQTRTRDDQTNLDTRSYVTQMKSAQYASRQAEQELAAVNNEITELQAENQRLQDELKRIESERYAQRSRSRR